MKFSVFLAVSTFGFASAQHGHPPHGSMPPAHSAPEIFDNTVNQAYRARLTGKHSGEVLAYADPTGWGTIFHLHVSSLDAAREGPFTYHIHEMPMQSGRGCASTGGHLDPYRRGSSPVCDSLEPESCEVGDLSGKYGKLEFDNSVKSFLDVYTSTTPGQPAFFGNRSIVIHNKSNQRIACANFHPVPMPPFGSGENENRPRRPDIHHKL